MSRAIRMLHDEGKISRAHLEQATQLQGRFGQTLSFHLISMGIIDENDFADFVEHNFPGQRWPRRKLKDIPRHVISLIPSRLAVNVRIIPVALEDDRLYLAITDSSRSYVLEEASYQTHCHISPAIVTESEMTWALEHYHGVITRSITPPESARRVQTDEHAFVAQREELPPVVIHKPSVHGRFVDTAVRRPPQDRLPTPVSLSLNSVRGSQPGTTETIAFESKESKPPASAQSERRVPLAVPRYPSWRPETLADKIRGSSHPPRPEEGAHSSGCVALASLVADMILDPAPRSLPEGYKKSKTPPPVRPSFAAQAPASLFERARSRDEVVDKALDFLLNFSARAAFFVVKGKRVQGHSIKGALTHTAAVRSFWIPTTAKCSLCEAVSQGGIRLGPLGDSAADSVFAASLGGRPSRALIIPIKIGHRVVCLLYSDGLTVDVPPMPALETFAEAVGSSLAELITKN